MCALSFVHPPAFPALVVAADAVVPRYDAVLVAMAASLAAFGAACYCLYRQWCRRGAAAVGALVAVLLPIQAEIIGWRNTGIGDRFNTPCYEPRLSSDDLAVFSRLNECRVPSLTSLEKSRPDTPAAATSTTTIPSTILTSPTSTSAAASPGASAGG